MKLKIICLLINSLIILFTGCNGFFTNPFSQDLTSSEQKPVTVSTPVSTSTPIPIPTNNYTTPTPTPDYNNLAFNRPCYASTYMRYNPPGSTNDGDINNGWCASGAIFPQWWAVKLNSIYSLSSIEFTDAIIGGAFIHYTIEISTDNINWTTALDKTGNTKTDQTQTESITGNAQYVRMKITELPPDNWAMLLDFKIYGSGTTPAPTPTATPGANLVRNSGFENDGGSMQNPSGWHSLGTISADYVDDEGGSYTHSGIYKLRHFAKTAYSVYTYQVITGLTNGLYTLRAWGFSDITGTGNYHSMIAKNYGGPELNTELPNTGNWQQITISNINVTNGQCEIGFISKGLDKQSRIDDVEFFKQ